MPRSQKQGRSWKRKDPEQGNEALKIRNSVDYEWLLTLLSCIVISLQVYLYVVNLRIHGKEK